MSTPNYDNLFIARAPSLEVKADGDGRIEGWASTFGGEPDLQGDVVTAGAFTASLARRRESGELPVMLWSHDLAAPIGRWTDFAEDPKGLHVRGSINLKTTRGRDTFEHVRAGDATGLSIGYRIPEGGRRYAGKGTFELTEVDLWEVSVVALPANPKARITGLKTLGSKAELVDLLKGQGIAGKAAQLIAAGGFKALAGENHDEKAMQLVRQIDGALERMKAR